MINTWQFNLIAYLLTVVLFYNAYKVAAKSSIKDSAVTIILQLSGALFALILIPLYKWTLPTDPKIYLLLLIASVFYALNNRLQTTARRHLPVSSFAVINQLNTVFMTLYSLVLYTNINVAHKILGASLIVLGNILLLWKGRKLEINRYVLVAVISALCSSTGVTIGILISKYFNLPFYIALTFVIPALMIKTAEHVTLQNIKAELVQGKVKQIALTGGLWTLAIMFSLRTFQFGEVSTVAPLQATSVFLNVIVAYVLLKERGSELQKIIASLLVALGVYTQV